MHFQHNALYLQLFAVDGENVLPLGLAFRLETFPPFFISSPFFFSASSSSSFTGIRDIFFSASCSLSSSAEPPAAQNRCATMSEADKYNQGDPQQQQHYQDQCQNQYQNQAQYDQGYNQNNAGGGGGYNPAYNANQQPVNDYQDHPYGPPPPYSFNPPQAHDEKYSFDDAFKIEKPKYHDWWAGILVSASNEIAGPKWLLPANQCSCSSSLRSGAM